MANCFSAALNDGCFHHKPGPGTEHNPLVLPRKIGAAPLIMCRTPKVGSTLVRQACSRLKQQSLYCVVASRDALGSNCSTRVVFVRHPVSRLISGFTTITSVASPELWARPPAQMTSLFKARRSGGSHVYRGSNATQVAATWSQAWNVFMRWLPLVYRSTCKNAHEYSTHLELQHVLPPQHCRCGMGCGLWYQRYKMEEHDLGAVLSTLGVPRTALPAVGSVVRPKWGGSSLTNGSWLHSFISKEDVARLDALTAHERSSLGYGNYEFRPNIAL
mmetsp:Transcript_29261/g.68457  ORF Transcript_29261/g.68457 Transcript_29261/m.68457 type:complete len:274 (-) Transcript_29261:429-1250(-)